MSQAIRIDDEVFTELQRRAQPFVDTPNDVLRRVLALNTPAGEQDEDQASAGDSTKLPDHEHDPGALAPLIANGDLSPGEQLVWDRPHVGTHYTATVTAGGRLRVDGIDAPPFKTPSGAALALGGHEINGWKQWRRRRDKTLLQDLR